MQGCAGGRAARGQPACAPPPWRLAPAGGVQLLRADADAGGGGSVAVWGALDDVVMGGCSTSGMSLQGGAGEQGAAAWVFRCIAGGCQWGTRAGGCGIASL